MSFYDFQQKIESDPALASKVSSAKTPEEIVQIANAEGFEIKASDISESDEIALEQLSQVSGGMAAFRGLLGSRVNSVTTSESVPECTATTTDTKSGPNCTATTTDTKDKNSSFGSSFTMK